MIKNVHRSSFEAPHSCQILMKLEFSRQIFEKYSYIKFHESPSSGSRGVPRGRAGGQTDRLTDIMMMLIVDFRNFANAPKIFKNFERKFMY